MVFPQKEFLCQVLETPTACGYPDSGKA